jgi:DNA-binding XRE family transcriptional regulator
MLTDVRDQTETNDYSMPAASSPAMNFDTQHLDAIDFQIGRRIRMRRRHLGMNQSDLARAIGVTFQQVHKYETGQSAVTAARLFAVAAALGCPVGYFYDDLNA